MILTQKQIELFDHDGYLILEDFAIFIDSSAILDGVKILLG